MELYPQIKILHVFSVLLSGFIFCARGGLMLLDSGLSNHRWARMTSYVNDSVLLLAGVTLMVQTQQYPVAQAWLSVKLGFLLLYIALGIFALRRGRTKSHRAVFLILAISVYLFMLSVARMHHPFGVFSYAF